MDPQCVLHHSQSGLIPDHEYYFCFIGKQYGDLIGQKENQAL